MKRTIFLILLVVLSQDAAAQTTSTTTTTVLDTAPKGSYDAEEVRSQFGMILRRMPTDVSTILVLDPSLLSNDPFINGYPEVAQFIAAHPEIRRSPRFFLAEFRIPEHRSSANSIAEAVSVIFGFGIAALTFAWLVRTFIEQRRWSRLSHIQTEVHNKILDRFPNSSELLEYIKTPAGAKFLESAPIPVHTGRAAQPTPRVIASLQLGIIIAAAAIGMIAASHRLDADAGRALFALGTIAASVGIGFVISSAISVFVSKRLGLWEQPPEVDVR